MPEEILNIIDKIGYKITLWFAVVCHIVQAVMLITAGAGFVAEGIGGYWWLSAAT